jgi:hypothetical protein
VGSGSTSSRREACEDQTVVVPNVGYLIGGRLFHPGDAFTPPGQPVEVLAVPAAKGGTTLRVLDDGAPADL